MHHATKPLAVMAGLLLLSASQAFGAAFAVRETSAEGIGTAYAGNGSRADEPATAFNNPAGMSWLSGYQIEVGAAVVVPDFRFTGTVTSGNTTLPGVNDRNIGQVALIPHAYTVFDISDRAKLGFSLTSPFGSTVDYGDKWPGRYVNEKTAALTIDLNPSISYRITDRVSVGGGVSYQYLGLGLRSGIAQSLILGAPDSYFTFHAASWAWGYNLGILAEPVDGLRLGLTYRSAIAHDIHGSLRFPPQTSPLLGLSTAPANSDVHLPSSITGSVTEQISPDLSLSSDVQFTSWHVFKELSVLARPNPTFTFVEAYRDSWMVSVGGVYRLSDVWSLRSGVGYDESPVLDAYRDTGVPDDDRYMLSAGAGIRLDETSTVDFGFTHYFASPASMNTSVNAIDPISGARLHGSYNNSLNYLSVSYRASL